jgi:hypothetical protein
MASKKNPLNLNALQLKTLTLFQALCELEGYASPAEEEGHVLINRLPHAHGDHFHLGPWVLAARDASGLANEAAWKALERKGLIRSAFPRGCVMTPAGIAYDTGLKDRLLQAGHH